VGDLGEMGPVNVVYRTSYGSNPHKLVQWGGDTGLAEHDDQGEAGESEGVENKKDPLPYDSNRDGVPDDVVAEGPVEPDDDFVLDFGDDYDDRAWKVYWNEDPADG
jgi:hypothetical protein